MKKIYALFIFSFFVAFSFGQISITATGTAFTQNFDGIGSSATATLPTGFKIGTDWSTGTSATSFAAGSTGAGVLSTTASGGIYNYANGVNASSTDRAIGFLTSGGFSSPRSIVLKITNNTGATVTDLVIAFDYEKYRNHTRGTDWTFFHGNTVTPSTAEALGNQSYSADAVVAILNPPTTISKSFTLTGLSIATSTDYYLRWTYTGVGGSSNSQGLGIDNFSVTANGGPISPCAEPLSVPTALTFGTITASSIVASFTATTSDKYIVVRSTSNTLSATPSDGTTYAINSALGGGTVIANVTSKSFTDFGLSQTTTYYYYVFAYNDVGCSGGPNYNITSYPTPNNATTLTIPACTTPAAPNNPIILTPANTSISGSFAGTGASKYLIIRSTALPPLGATPTDGTIYTAGQTIGNGAVVTYTTATNFVASALTPANTYYFYVYAANDGCTGTPPVYSTTFADGNSTTTNNTGIPPGYYNAAAGLTCAPLKTAVSTIITTGHTQNNYGGLDNIEMLTTDDRLNDAGTATIVWDMYSDNPNGADPYTFTFAQFNVGSSSDGEGNGWNKEHSFPNSWFSASSSTANFPGADLYHLYPTDMDVNGLRSNYPYGKVATATTTTANGSKLGSSALVFPGYSGPVFEPIDAYKGDLARATLYMVTRYQAEQPTWENLQAGGDVVMDGTTYPSVEINYLKMLIQWHNQDPVSTKETDRNNTVYAFQGNRNPFVDHPEYVGQIWSSTCGLALPINLNYFTAKLIENNVQLNWNADNAIGFSHFVVERSIDGINFAKVGEVRGTTNINYTFTDKDFPNVKAVYYKLKMVDNDGVFKNSDIVLVKLNNNFSNALVYPNPTLGPLYIKLNEALYTNCTLQVSDVSGRILKQQIINSFTRNINLDVKELSAGRYFIKIANDKQIINQSFVIMK